MIVSEHVLIGAPGSIHASSVVDARFRPLLDGRRCDSDIKAQISPDVWIGHFCVIGQGAVLGAGSLIEDFVYVGPGARLGRRVILTARSHVCMGAAIGDGCVIGGYVGDNVRVGDGCRVFGQLIHRQLDATAGWDDQGSEEPAPIVEDCAFVGWNALLIGGVTIGAGAYVAAGAIITKDVPPGHIARGRNEIFAPEEWPGALGTSPFFPTRTLTGTAPDRPTG